MAIKAQRRQTRRQAKTDRQETRLKAIIPHRIPLVAKNSNQRALITAGFTASQVFAIGPAGTGKTYILTRIAADKLLDGSVERIILVRPTVGAEEEQGYLPGSLHSKMAPWVAPFMDVFKECWGAAALQQRLADGSVEIVPISYMRGRTFKNAFVIIDEAQNATLSQLKLILTRVGEGSTIAVTGDLSQSDIGARSGLGTILAMIHRFRMSPSVVQFESADVVRSDTCREWTQAFDLLESDREP